MSFALVFRSLAFEQRRLARIQHGVNRPILLRNETRESPTRVQTISRSADRLHASGGKVPRRKLCPRAAAEIFGNPQLRSSTRGGLLARPPDPHSPGVDDQTPARNRLGGNFH